MTGMARVISKEVRIGVDTLPEIKDAAKACAGELGRKIKFNGQSLSLQGLMNALILDFIGRPRDEQLARIGAAIEKLNALQELDDDENRKLPTYAPSIEKAPETSLGVSVVPRPLDPPDPCDDDEPAPGPRARKPSRVR